MLCCGIAKKNIHVWSHTQYFFVKIKAINFFFLSFHLIWHTFTCHIMLTFSCGPTLVWRDKTKRWTAVPVRNIPFQNRFGTLEPLNIFFFYNNSNIVHYRLNIYCLAGSCWEEGSKLLHCDQKQTAKYRYSGAYQFALFKLQYIRKWYICNLCEQLQ